jgi:hypothetical protein
MHAQPLGWGAAPHGTVALLQTVGYSDTGRQANADAVKLLNNNTAYTHRLLTFLFQLAMKHSSVEE